MTQCVDILEVEAAINRLREDTPPVDGKLPEELRQLAEVYACMIYAGAHRVDLAQLSPTQRELLLLWARQTK